jgi:hypothetical protein
MASETFQRLFQKAMQREYALIEDIQRLFHSPLGMTDLQAAHQLALGLQSAHEEFIDKLEPVAMRMGRTLRGHACPGCGDPDCPGASMAGQIQVIPMKGLLMGLIQKMLGGKGPPEQK